MKLVELLYQNRDKFTLHDDCKWLSQDSSCLVNMHTDIPVLNSDGSCYTSDNFINYARLEGKPALKVDICTDRSKPLSRSDYEQYCKEQDEKLLSDIDNALIRHGVEKEQPSTQQETQLGSQSTDQMIAERGQRYGRFEDGAEIMQQLKHIAHMSQAWERMKPIQREGMDMILHKIGRVLYGDPFYDDNWKDIAGYAKLIADYLNGDSK